MPFPKVLIIEHLEHACTPLTKYVRIYERSSLDSFCPQTSAAFAQSRLAFLFLEGTHTNQQGQVLNNMAAAEPFMEKVTGGELLLGGRASAHLRCFVATLCQGYAASHADLAITPAVYHAG